MALVLAIFLIAAYWVVTYNKFISLKNAGEAALNQIRVALKKRLDLLAELLDATKSYAKYERSTIESVTRLRAESYRSPREIAEADRESGRILAGVLGVLEAYPQLRASEPVVNMMEAARSVENEIARLRYTYNSIAQQYNTMAEQFPSSLIASLSGFRRMEYLEIQGNLEERPSLSFEA